MNIRNEKDSNEVREDVFSSSYAPVGFNANPCNFARLEQS